MYTSNGAAERARWEVLWVKDGRVVQNRFGTDLAEATRIYALAVKAGKKAATLRCANMGFPPPEELQPRYVRGKRHGKPVEGLIIPMRRRNAEGIWWCPYCMKLRRFVKRKYSTVQGVKAEDPRMCCPMCGISHRDGHVRKWNPIANRYYNQPGRIVDPNRKRRRRERRKKGES